MKHECSVYLCSKVPVVGYVDHPIRVGSDNPLQRSYYCAFHLELFTGPGHWLEGYAVTPVHTTDS